MIFLCEKNVTNKIWGEGGWVRQPIKVRWSRVYPFGHLSTINPHCRSEGRRQGSDAVFLGEIGNPIDEKVTRILNENLKFFGIQFRCGDNMNKEKTCF